MKFLLSTCFLVTSFFSFSQVGIYTTDPKASLDIEAVNTSAPLVTDGILIPRIDAFSLVNPSGQQDGMLVFVTGAAATPRGFYFWDKINSSWKPSDTDSLDSDWYKASTTNIATTITDNIYTQGNVGVGLSDPMFGLDVLSDSKEKGIQLVLQGNEIGDVFGVQTSVNNTGAGDHSAYQSILNGSGSGIQYGLFNSMIGIGEGLHFGVYNEFSQNTTNLEEHAGIKNRFIANNDNVHNGISTINNSNGLGVHRGMITELNGSGDGFIEGASTIIANSGDGPHKGTISELVGSGAGSHMGTVNSLSGSGTGEQFAVNNEVKNTNNRNHYGLYNVMSGSGNGFHYGVNNILIGGDGFHFGTKNQVSGTGDNKKYGSSNYISNLGNGTHYGTENILNGSGIGKKYGSWNKIEISAGGEHYGVFSDVQKLNSWAGYFIGKVEIVGDTKTTGNLEVNGPSQFNGSIESTGQITANNYIATTSGVGYADYVFEKYYNGYSGINQNYSFISIEDAEQFVKTNGHLKGIISYDEVKANNFKFDLSDLSLSLLEKLEEQFLYTVELNSSVKLLEKTNKEQQRQIQSLEDRLSIQENNVREIKNLLNKK
ncbi:MAG: hypothetical protein ACI825_000164 [Planctomycetota bacterium]|jgi:hypothetical protein